MMNLSLNELKLIPQIRNIRGYKNKSKEGLIKAIKETKPKTLKPETKPKTTPKQTLKLKAPKQTLKPEIPKQTLKPETPKTTPQAKPKTIRKQTLKPETTPKQILKPKTKLEEKFNGEKLEKHILMN